MILLRVSDGVISNLRLGMISLRDLLLSWVGLRLVILTYGSRRLNVLIQDQLFRLKTDRKLRDKATSW